MSRLGLKPCPFCGKKAKKLRDKVIQCVNDSCPCAPMTCGSLYKTNKEAIEAWNRRKG